MATRRQLAANRRNAVQSTGPRTVAGKKVAALNALRHGLTSQTVVLPDEDPAEFERHAVHMSMYWLPQGQQENMLVERIVHLSWRLLRLAKIEVGVLRVEYVRIEADARPHVVNLENVGPWAFAESTTKGILEKLCRYESSKEKSLSRTMRDLMFLQDRRRRQDRDPVTKASLLKDQIGFLKDLAKELPANSKLQELAPVGFDVLPKTELSRPPTEGDRIDVGTT